MSAPVHFEVIKTANGHAIGVATLDSPATLNALSLEIVDLLDAQLQQWQQDPTIVAVWLDASSEKAFCAGGDLQQLYTGMREAGSGRNAYAENFFAREYRLDHRVHQYPKPLVAWMHGIVMGGGIGLACGAAHRVVTERSMLAMPETTIGLFPDVGGSWFLSRVAGGLGRYLALTGARLKAGDAIFAGLADLPIAQTNKAAVMAGLAGLAWTGEAANDHAVLRRHLRAAADWSLAANSDLVPRFAALANISSAATVQDAVAEVIAYAEQDEWAKPHAQALATAAPSSLVLSWAMQERLGRSSLAEVLRSEYAAALGCSAHGDFAEGIRALIIDKDKMPRWNPPKLEQADDALVAELLKPRWVG
ncbi:MAG: enoyl-CoA hydratase/isomerase family protein, partial [Pseudomonadota bacterium]|nr:enoyl-CoA hydratase/isomerase family protein [Pseudomonadota bacterium]